MPAPYQNEDYWRCRSATGYQQGILLALGSQSGDCYIVRSIDRWYPEQVSGLLEKRIYQLTREDRESPQYVVKSRRGKDSALMRPKLCDVVDKNGFARAWVEIHGAICPITQTHNKKGGRMTRHNPGMKIYGQPDVLEFLMRAMPVRAKAVQKIVNSIDGQYVGATYYVRFQRTETESILRWIDGEPRNEAVWDKWMRKIERIEHMDD